MHYTITTYTVSKGKAYRLYRYNWCGSLLATLLLLTSNTVTASTWEEESFVGNTRYTISNQGGTETIKGVANQTASLLYRRHQIDLLKTPLIHWRWRINNIYRHGISENSRKGDDFPARVYVVVKTGWLPWQTLAINYVWSSNGLKGDDWPSPYTKKSHMVVVEAGEQNVGTWVTVKRDVRKDFKQFFDKDINELQGYAVMVDGDNTKSSGTAWFSGISFQSKDPPLEKPD